MSCYAVCFVVCCFFFKQKTAYEMRISDWSSDVCSSDLNTIAPARAAPTTIFLLSHWTVLSEGMRFGRSAAGVRSISFTSGVASTSNLLSDTSVLRRALDSFRHRIRLGIATVEARAFVVDAQHHLPPAQAQLLVDAMNDDELVAHVEGGCGFTAVGIDGEDGRNFALVGEAHHGELPVVADFRWLQR